jgi:hypothetical protein
MFSIISQHYFDMGMLRLLLPNSSVRARRSTACLSTPNYFSLCRNIACILPTHHEPASTPFNMLVAFPTLTIVVERPLFHLAMGFIFHISLVVFRWTKCTPQSYPTYKKFDPHEDLAWRQLSWSLNWMLSLILTNLSLDRKILALCCETSFDL